jgi:hypothetical protein
MSIITDLTKGATSGLFSGIGSLVGSIRTAITGKTVLSSEEQAGLMKQAAEIEAAAQRAQTDLALAQIEVNKIEAASASFFKSGWRPGAGWVCVAGLSYDFLVRPILPWVLQVCGATAPPLPPLDMGTLIALLGGLLGLGGMRSLDKKKSAA